jgi:O-6-methylguanine DNA methyltransferase
VKAREQVVQLSIATPDGTFVARYSENGLASLNFPGTGRASLPVGPDARQRVPVEINRWHRLTTAALQRALAGREPQALPPLDLSAGTSFQQNVWNAMRKIRAGQTRSYGEIANAVGKPKAVRAVGGACGANPIPVLVPCHRVIAANEKIGGFSADMNWKLTLLAREGIHFEEQLTLA